MLYSSVTKFYLTSFSPQNIFPLKEFSLSIFSPALNYVMIADHHYQVSKVKYEGWYNYSWLHGYTGISVKKIWHCSDLKIQHHSL